MRVVLLFYGQVHTGLGPPPTAEAFAELVEGHLAYERDVLRPNAEVVLGQALYPATTARTVAFDGTGGPTASAGPAVATEEALGGFYVVDCADLDQAERLAARYPMAPGAGRIEVRPLIGFDPALRARAEAEPVTAGSARE